MSCCGHRRAAASAATNSRGDRSTTPRRAAASRAAPIAAVRAAEVRMRYLGVQPVRVRGTASGRIYNTSAADPSLTIDPRDAAGLIRTGLFRAG